MSRKRNELLVDGYVKENSDQMDIFIPAEINTVILKFYPQKFEFKNNNEFEDQVIINNDGLTFTTKPINKIRSKNKKSKSKRIVNFFGQYLYHLHADKLRVTFKLDKGGHSGVEIGFCTTKFDIQSYQQNLRMSKHATSVAGNGWFRIDLNKFESVQEFKDSTHLSNQYQYFRNLTNQNELTLDVNMETKIGKIGECIVTLPDALLIFVSTMDGNTITALRQEFY